MEDYIMQVKRSRKADRERPEAVATLDVALDAVHKIRKGS